MSVEKVKQQEDLNAINPSNPYSKEVLDLVAFYSDYKKSLVGKRDSVAWFYGIISPIVTIAFVANSLHSLHTITIPKYVLSAFYLYFAIVVCIISFVGIGFFLGKRWSRKAFYVIPFALSIIFPIIMSGKLITDAIFEQIFFTLFGSFFFLLFFFAFSNSVTNRSFFKLPVSDKKIKKHWLLYSNKKAMWSSYIAVLFPVIVAPVIGIFNIFENIIPDIALRIIYVVILLSVLSFNIRLAISARKNVNLNGIPPIGGKGHANLAFVLSIIWICLIITGVVIGVVNKF